ncbi:lysyl oxidase homolog 3 isoform X1 [Artibeus jamaicensis]|uniref:lysyl oxidase homolog 3 isoform X1 n=1 Tax=Artibeus jamaicensis TaxID=9417 RepID=UPI00235B1711|nr:lysyl oxidase homolog 3 isoform X1 [Artibeus jamaicensis]
MQPVSVWWQSLWGLLLCLLCSSCLGSPSPSTAPEKKAGSQGLRFRLAGFPRKPFEGRVEIQRAGEWGTICDDDFTLEAAHVLCRELGFTEATGWTHSAKYGPGTGRIWLDNLSCSGTEHSVAECASRGWGNSDCTHDEDAGVICKDQRLPGFPDSNVIEVEHHLQVEEVRLRPAVGRGRRPLPVTEGLVEVRLSDGWFKVCDKGWSAHNSHVVCGMLGFPSEKRVNTAFYRKLRKRAAKASARRPKPLGRPVTKHKVKSKPRVGRGPTKRLLAQRQQHSFGLHGVTCVGTEAHLSRCSLEFYRANDTTRCPGGAPAVVSCVPGPVYATSNGQKKQQQSKPQGEARVRLKGGAHPGEGRVEVLKAGTWGTVCDRKWDLQAASVVCRELGFGSAREALRGARMGQGMGAIHLSEVRCSGQEPSLWKCPHKNITAEDCSHGQDAGVRCNLPYTGVETRIRLSGGRSRHEGRVEVQIGGPGPLRWGLICGDDWGTLEAMVVCRQLGLGYANHGLQETWYWDSGNITEVVMSGVRCIGTELSLDQCAHHGTHIACKRTDTRFTAGVICSETASDLLLHSALVQETAYIEDRPLHMLYCAAEENCLAHSARSANWPYGHRRLLRFSSQIHNLGRADFRPKAGRHSWVWHECHGHYHSMDIFTHYDILTPNGTKVAEGHKASFCLEDTECQEDVSKRYECANFGEQGITVGCWDLYRHDIDCQWIDITDVKPGNYILQVVINPNFEVAESDFTNNAMKCNCKYDGHRIWVHNCHIGDAFSEEANKRFERYPGQTSNQVI